ncbi:ATP-binding cassette domain-containing protein [uncultured Serinicoccus sp.]|uniref:ATP-binding cassette domain-containing protein n=1 Tax=uncultured Serinicoccus sp. TaxID=735514 RepID=UPI002617226C|nr:ABC transporter ATP-binding protein [uncultured Serinicoccus sp.]
MTGLSVTTRDVSVRYGAARALDGVTLDLAPGRIHGLLGRNGAGKTTLLSLLASFQRPDSGDVALDGRDPFEDARLMQDTSLMRATGDLAADLKIRDILRLHRTGRAHFDRDLADHLLDRFDIPRRRSLARLSRGQQSVVAATIGLASRAPLTMLDEVHLGMDAPTRQEFTEALLADFAEHPRTIIVSSHLIHEIEHVLETVTILHRGRVVLSEEADDLRTQGTTVTGRADRVEVMTRDLRVVGRRDLGPTREATVLGRPHPAWVTEAERQGLQLGAAPLQDLFIHLTSDRDAA